jgi:hypothetical protein
MLWTRQLRWRAGSYPKNLASWIGDAIERYVVWLSEQNYAARNVFGVPILLRFGEYAQSAGASNGVEMPEWAVDSGKYWDPKKFIRLCRDAHVEIIEVKSKNMSGDAMFPFRDRSCPEGFSALFPPNGWFLLFCLHELPYTG